MTSKIKKPKRKPDYILRSGSTEDMFAEVVELWFKELVLGIYTVEDGERQDDYTLYSLDRTVSLRDKINWFYSYDNLNYEFLDFILEMDTEGLQQRVEKAYQDWLATSAIEKMLKIKKIAPKKQIKNLKGV